MFEIIFILHSHSFFTYFSFLLNQVVRFSFYDADFKSEISFEHQNLSTESILF